MLETRREMAERHVTTGRRIIAAHRQLIERLRAAGGDCSEAQGTLALYERMQVIFEYDLENV